MAIIYTGFSRHDSLAVCNCIIYGWEGMLLSSGFSVLIWQEATQIFMYVCQGIFPMIPGQWLDEVGSVNCNENTRRNEVKCLFWTLGTWKSETKMFYKQEKSAPIHYSLVFLVCLLFLNMALVNLCANNMNQMSFYSLLHTLHINLLFWFIDIY